MRDRNVKRSFEELFCRWSRQVRGRVLLGRTLTGLAAGLGAGALVSALSWWLGEDIGRRLGALVGLAGLGVAVLHDLRHRWSDEDVALYLDAKLGTHEAITSAVALAATPAEPSESALAVLRRAVRELSRAARSKARPRWLRPWQGLAPLGVGGVVFFSVIPLPATPPQPPAPPGAEIVRKVELRGLAPTMALSQLDEPDPERRARLREIAKDARELRDALARGTEKRDAQARVAKLRDAVARERLRLGDQENRAGLDAAVRELTAHSETQGASRALALGDLAGFDDEMARLADAAEQDARKIARDALAKAREGAHKSGARSLTRALEEQALLFERREARVEVLRELAEALRSTDSDSRSAGDPSPPPKGLDGLDPNDHQRLAEALNRALSRLSPAERQRLAEQLRTMADAPTTSPRARQHLAELAEDLASSAGQERLEKNLRELAAQEQSLERRREQGLGEAERGMAEAQRELGVVPMPAANPTSPTGRGVEPGQPASDGAQQQRRTDGTAGPTRPGLGGRSSSERATHEGRTNAIPGGELRARAGGRLGAGPLFDTGLGRASPVRGETANQQGTGALGRVGRTETDAVEHALVPEEYREQVGRYFAP